MMAKTSKPQVTLPPSGGSGTPDAGLTGGFSTLPGTSTADPTGWTAASKAELDTTGLNIPGLSGKATGAQIFAAIESAAKTNAGNGKIWGALRPLIAVGNSYTNAQAHVNWSSADVTALQKYIAAWNNYNTTNPSTPATLGSWVNLTKNTTATTGASVGQTLNLVTTTPVSVPAQADLTSVAQQAFASTLGRSASPKEAADFAKKYQELILSYGSSKDLAKASQSFQAPSSPIQFQQSGQAPQSSAPIPSMTSGVNAVTAPPTASVAASNYAAQTNPTEASAQAASDGLNQFMSMLKGA